MSCSCGGKLSVGFIPDFGTLATWVGIWMPGEPERNKTFVQKLATGGGVATDLEQARQIEAYRCESCGRLELFANQTVKLGLAPG